MPQCSIMLWLCLLCFVFQRNYTRKIIFQNISHTLREENFAVFGKNREIKFPRNLKKSSAHIFIFSASYRSTSKEYRLVSAWWKPCFKVLSYNFLKVLFLQSKYRQGIYVFVENSTKHDKSPPVRDVITYPYGIPQ